MRRSTTSSGTTLTVYAFGLEEHHYSGSGTNQSNLYYYALGGRLIGSLDANGTTFYLSDALGSLLASFTNSANSAALKSNQLFSPYGSARYTSGTLNTAKGSTGQYNDSLTGLDYYGVRYYDPVVGLFLSADKVQGNLQGMNPYAYVGGNPETHSDPTGQYRTTSGGGIGNAPPPPQSPPPPPPPSCNFLCTFWHGVQTVGSELVHVVAKAADLLTGATSIVSDVKTLFDPKASLWDKIKAGIDGVLNVGMDVLMVNGI